jgi:hypothetical protein
MTSSFAGNRTLLFPGQPRKKSSKISSLAQDRDFLQRSRENGIHLAISKSSNGAQPRPLLKCETEVQRRALTVLHAKRRIMQKQALRFLSGAGSAAVGEFGICSNPSTREYSL